MTTTLNITDTFTQMVTKFNELSTGVGTINDLDIAGESDLANIITHLYSLIDSDTDFTGKISATDVGGDGSLVYNSATGVITYTGPSASEVRAHFSGGDGIDITSGTVGITSPTRFRLFDSNGATLLDLYGAGSL